jgi:hypothetical protein
MELFRGYPALVRSTCFKNASTSNGYRFLRKGVAERRSVAAGMVRKGRSRFFACWATWATKCCTD